MSEVKQVSAALVKAQKSFGPALKTSSNPHFRSQYADLSACVEAVIDALNEAGIMLMQRNIPCDSGVTVETVFIHESGESISSGPLHVPASKNDPQGYGSALTYARRYSLMAACGIAPEDDDGNAASKNKGVRILPVPESRTKLAPEREEAIKEVVKEMRSAWDDGAQTAVLNAWRSITDNEEKIALWDELKADSKIRSFLKANKTESK